MSAQQDGLPPAAGGGLLGRVVGDPATLLAVAWITMLFVAALTADLWVAQTFDDPLTIDTQTAAANRLLGPSLSHPMGTDDLGRDIFGRIVYGARVSLAVGVFAVLLAAVVGSLLGLIAGFYGRWIDALVMRGTDVFMTFPYVLFAVLVLAVLPQSARGVLPLVLAIGLLGWPAFARLLRGSVLSVKESAYVEAARALGSSNARLMFKHIAPNAIAPVIAYATVAVGSAILVEGALSFLGLGVQPPAVSWGQMIDSGRAYLGSAPGLVLWPGLATLATVLAFTALGDRIRDGFDTRTRSGHE